MKTKLSKIEGRVRDLLNKKDNEIKLKQLKEKKKVNLLAKIEDKIPNYMIKSRKEVKQRWIN